jgi:hypothetical protein
MSEGTTTVFVVFGRSLVEDRLYRMHGVGACIPMSLSVRICRLHA